MTAKILTLLLSITVCFVTLAEGPVRVTPSSTSGVYNLTYKSTEAGKVVVSIVNEKDQPVFTEVIRNAVAFVRPYNLSNLSDGKYSIKVTDKTGTHVETITYSRSSTFLRVRPLAGDAMKYIVTVINNKPEAVTVRIFENQGALIYEGVNEVNGTQSTIYNLENLNLDRSAIILFEISTNNGKVETAIF